MSDAPPSARGGETGRSQTVAQASPSDIGKIQPWPPTEAVPLIYNPVSGHGQGKRVLAEAQRVLEAKGIRTQPAATQSAGHATELSRSLADAGHRLILVLGGDGTLSEAANGVLGLPASRRPTIGALPAGTGNDFLRDFGAAGLESTIERIGAGTTRLVDVAHVHWPGPQGPAERFMLNLVGTGLMARAGMTANQHLKPLGRRGYDLAAAYHIAKLGPCPTKLKLDGVDADGDYPLVAICNSVHTGGAMPMAPDASPMDGQLDVVTVTGAGRAALIGLLATKLRKGLHVQDPRVQVRRAKRIEVVCEPASPLLVDGEVLGNTPVKVKVLPGAMTLLG